VNKFERNTTFVAVREAGFDPTEFELHTRGPETELLHSPSHSRLAIGLNDYAKRWVDAVVARRPAACMGMSEWNAALDSWLAELKDLDTPDLWESLADPPQLLDLSSGTDNSRFSAWEQAEITRQFAALITETEDSLPHEDKLRLEERIAYLEEAAMRVGRLDWRTLVVGALLGDVVTGLLPPDATRVVLLGLFRALAHLLGHQLPELPQSF
jgi:hypothetical protein